MSTTPVFNAASFSVNTTSIPCVGVLGRGDDQDKFNARYGSSWKKHPKKDLYFLRDKEGNNHMTMRLMQDGRQDIALYDCTFDELKAYNDGGEYQDACFIQSDPKYKYVALQLVEWLKQLDCWK